MRPRNLLLLLAVATILGLVLYFNYASEVETPSKGRARDETRPSQPREPTRPSAPKSGDEEPEPATGVAPAKRWARRLKNAEARRELLRLIERAREARADLAGGSEGTASQGTLDKQYIRDVIKEAVPLLQECYELALRETPELAGRFELEFTISGEPEVGGIVEQVAIPTDAGVEPRGTLPECLKQTVLSLQFPEPQGGGKVKVRYPFTFRQKKRQ